MSEQLLVTEVDKIEQIKGNVLSYTTKYKEQLNTSAFDNKSSSGVTEKIDNNKHNIIIINNLLPSFFNLFF